MGIDRFVRLVIGGDTKSTLKLKRLLKQFNCTPKNNMNNQFEANLRILRIVSGLCSKDVPFVLLLFFQLL